MTNNKKRLYPFQHEYLRIIKLQIDLRCTWPRWDAYTLHARCTANVRAPAAAAASRRCLRRPWQPCPEHAGAVPIYPSVFRRRRSVRHNHQNSQTNQLGRDERRRRRKIANHHLRDVIREPGGLCHGRPRGPLPAPGSTYGGPGAGQEAAQVLGGHRLGGHIPHARTG